MMLVAVAAAAHAQSVPNEITGHKLPLPGEKVEGTTAKLSEVEAEMVAHMGPQEQSERLLQYAVSHHIGATDEIKRRAPEWRGKLALSEKMSAMLDTAVNGDDLRVRAAALEVELAIANVEKTEAEADRLIDRVRKDPKQALSEIFLLGALANRGVASEKIFGELKIWMHDPTSVDVRFWAVSAISSIGKDETVPELVWVFHYDPSDYVRVSAGGCGLAHCGMLTRAQRMQSIPGLIELVRDKKVDANTVKHGYRALREITDVNIGDDAAAWAEWFAVHGPATTEKFRRWQKELEERP